MKQLPPLDANILKKMGLNPQRIAEHQRRIFGALSGNLETNIPVEKECSLANGGIVSLEKLSQHLPEKNEAFEKWLLQNVASLVPAAGAASRHFKDVHAFVKQCEQTKMFVNNDTQSIARHLSRFADVFEKHMHMKPVPVFKRTIAEKGSLARAYAAAKALVETFGEEPKALVETTTEGDDFLDLKMIEQKNTFPVAKNVLIVSAGREQEFSKILADKAKKHELANHNWQTTEQGLDLSTIRFLSDGSPVMSDNLYSVVSAGHGELVHVISKLAKEEPCVECIHIRNVDNVIGASASVRKTMNALAHSFYEMSRALNCLRRVCAGKIEFSSREASHALARLQTFADAQIVNSQKDFFAQVAQIGEILFDWSHDVSPSKESMAAKLARPLSLMAMIRRDPADVGGGPVFAALQGQKFKICLETPHASPADYETFFSDTGLMKHFNPGFVFFEARNGSTGRAVESDALYDSRFWLLSKKDYQGQTVYYHETVLYELIGNAARNNVVFVEVPRHVFQPHKAVFDSLEKSRQSYGF